MITEQELQLLKVNQEELAGPLLTPAVARLYSQFKRVSASQPSLQTWNEREAESRLNDAFRLFDAGFALRSIGDERHTLAFRRAAEIFEWLSHSEVLKTPAP